MQKIIEVEIFGKQINAEVFFDYRPQVNAVTNCEPDYGCKGEDEEFTINDLALEDCNGEFTVDASELIAYVEDEIILAIKGD